MNTAIIYLILFLAAAIGAGIFILLMHLDFKKDFGTDE